MTNDSDVMDMLVVMVAFLFLAVDMSVGYNFLEGKVNCVVWERMHVRFFFF